VVKNACKRLIDTVFDVLRTNIARLNEKLRPVASKTRERVQETWAEAETIAQELKVNAEQQVAEVYDKAVHLTDSVSHQAAEILQESKAHLEEVVEEIKETSEQTVAEVKARTTAKAKPATAKATVAKAPATKATATKTTAATAAKPRKAPTARKPKAE
jgi:F0F1-type ATP synthase membrane subunit b/b'